jgi:hypothetical protein
MSYPKSIKFLFKPRHKNNENMLTLELDKILEADFIFAIKEED